MMTGCPTYFLVAYWATLSVQAFISTLFSQKTSKKTSPGDTPQLERKGTGYKSYLTRQGPSALGSKEIPEVREITGNFKYHNLRDWTWTSILWLNWACFWLCWVMEVFPNNDDDLYRQRLFRSQRSLYLLERCLMTKLCVATQMKLFVKDLAIFSGRFHNFSQCNLCT